MYEIAKELGVPSKDLLAKLSSMGVEAKSHSSTVTQDVADRLRSSVGGGPAPSPGPRIHASFISKCSAGTVTDVMRWIVPFGPCFATEYPRLSSFDPGRRAVPGSFRIRHVSPSSSESAT